jgi:SpoVK/Ycf46/Vps4 family AAA+-type ATPase
MKFHEISLLLRSHVPILVLQTHEEARAVELLKDTALNMNTPVFKWSVATGMQRVDLDLDPQAHLKEPAKLLAHINSANFEGIYLLLDFHPYLEDPVNVRLLKELAMTIRKTSSKLVLVSHKIDIPPEVKKMAVHFELSLPDDEELMEIVKKEASAFARENSNLRVSTDKKVLHQLVNNLKGLPHNDARRLAHAAIVDDGAITESDLDEVMQAKYKLMSRDDLLSFEFETSKFSDLAGMTKLKEWLRQREKFFHQSVNMTGMESPRGILLLGVQGCGKSVAAKAVAGVWKVPLLRLDFGRLYNKYIGESESNIREALKTAEVMSPCVLWIDELEKGISTSEHDDGTSQRILGTLLTWMAENRNSVFIVATSNAIDRLPPELIRKGRLDEVFFVDLPTSEVRERIFHIHADRRAVDKSALDMGRLAQLTDGFSGSEIEQLVVSGIYAAHADETSVTMQILVDEIKNTKPLSILMAEKISALRQWAEGRTVSVD